MSTAPPIEPAPAGLPSNRGCWKGALLGCGATAVLLVAALVAIGVYVQKRPTAVTDLVMERIRARYASDVTEQDKAGLDAAYADFRRALEDRNVAKEDLDRVRVTVRLGREVGREEVRALTQVFREASTRSSPSGLAPPPEPASPSPAATPLP